MSWSKLKNDHEETILKTKYAHKNSLGTNFGTQNCALGPSFTYA